MPDGTWRCVFQVNDYANQFAVAYSTDLVKWQPQDYPYMEGVNSCIAPVLSYDVATAAYKVLFKTKDGGVYETVSKDFYHFSKPRKVDASVYPSVTEQALVDGQPVKGQVFKVPYAGVERMVQAVESAAYWAALNGELARDNEVRFQGLKPLEATIKIDAGRTKKISDKLIGIFLRTSVMPPTADCMPSWCRTVILNIPKPMSRAGTRHGKLILPGHWKATEGRGRYVHPILSMRTIRIMPS